MDSELQKRFNTLQAENEKLQTKFEALQQQNRNLKGELSKVWHVAGSRDRGGRVMTVQEGYQEGFTDGRKWWVRHLREINDEVSARDFESTNESSPDWNPPEDRTLEDSVESLLENVEARLEVADDKVARAFAILGEQRSTIKGPITSEYNKPWLNRRSSDEGY